jgi:hypothetical protein
MDLLSGIRPVIYEALENVKDTFFQVPCAYKLAGQDAVSDWMEDLDRDGGKTYTDYTLNVLLEQGDKQLQESQSGVLDENEAQITVFVSDLVALGLWSVSSGTHILSAEQDYFFVKSERYRVTNIKMDGFFESAPQLVVITGVKVIASA